MTNYNKWEAKASALVREAEEDDQQEALASDTALGLQDGPRGPSMVKAEEQLQELGGHSKGRQDFITWQKKKEVTFSHKSQASPLELAKAEVDGQMVRLNGSEDVDYVLPENARLGKLVIENCSRVRIQVKSAILTSTIEAYCCTELALELEHPIGTIQVDECTGPVRIRFAELDQIGSVYHQNSPGLQLGWGGSGTFRGIGSTDPTQYCTNRAASESGYDLVTLQVGRGEGEYPLTLSTASGESPMQNQSEPEDTVPPERHQQVLAEEKRQRGNDMFRANDFMQAAAEYSFALELDPSIDAVWANRAQCWLKLGNHEKALADATRCAEVNPANPKGWFRKGMCLHAMKRYQDAIPALLEAEKLEPTNKQIQDSIKMAQLMCRRSA